MPPRADVPGRPAGKTSRPVNKRATVVRLLKYMMQFRWLLLTALFLTLTANALALIGPRLAGEAVDVIAGQGDSAAAGNVDFAKVGRLCLEMLFFYLLSSVLSYILQLLMVRISRKVTMRMRNDLFRRLSDMPVGFSDRHASGDLISRIFYDTDTINTSLSSDVVNVMASAVSLVGSFIMMLTINPLLTGLFLFIIPLTTVLTTLLTRKTQPLFRMRSRKMGELNDFS